MTFFATYLTANATALRFIVRYLAHAPEAVAPSQLAAAVHPGGEEGAATQMFKDSLAVGALLGLLDTDGDRWTVARQFAPVAAAASESLEGIRPYILAGLGGSVAASPGQVRVDLVKALCWACYRSPMEPLPERHADVERELRRSNAGIANETQWRAFLRWGSDLGVLRRLPGASGYVVDPSVALSGLLRASLLRRGSGVEFRDSLREVAPMLSDAALARTVLGDQAEVPPDLSPAVTFAVMVLVAAEVLYVESRADAPGTFRLQLGSRSLTFGQVLFPEEV